MRLSTKSLQIGTWLVVGFLTVAGHAHAKAEEFGEIALILPLPQLRALTTLLCTWTLCQSEANGGYKTEAEQLAWITAYFVDEDSFARALWLAGKVVAEHRYAEFFRGSRITLRYDTEGR